MLIALQPQNLSAIQQLLYTQVDFELSIETFFIDLENTNICWTYNFCSNTICTKNHLHNGCQQCFSSSNQCDSVYNLLCNMKVITVICMSLIIKDGCHSSKNNVINKRIRTFIATHVRPLLNLQFSVDLNKIFTHGRMQYVVATHSKQASYYRLLRCLKSTPSAWISHRPGCSVLVSVRYSPRFFLILSRSLYLPIYQPPFDCNTIDFHTNQPRSRILRGHKNE